MGDFPALQHVFVIACMIGTLDGWDLQLWCSIFSTPGQQIQIQIPKVL